MLKNYFKIAFRNLIRLKTYSFINILGLAVGMTCTILILLWVQDELSYDRFFPNIDRLYRVTDSEKYADGSEVIFTQNPPPLAQTLVEKYPDIINAARLRVVKNSVVQYGEKRFTEDNLTFVDPSFLEMFTFKFKGGSNNKALTNPSSIVLTQKVAEKYFGNENPVGKTIHINNHLDFIVDGIIDNVPSNSHLTVDFLLPFNAIENFGYALEGWESFAHTTYVLLSKGADYKKVSKKIANVIKQNLEGFDVTVSLQPVSDIHLYSGNIWGIGGTGDITRIYIFSVIAVLILLLACINFMNLATARAGNRAREIGVRKVVGANRKEIIYQFFLESNLYAFVSLVFSIFLILELLPLFNSLSGKQLTFGFQNNLDILLLIFGVTVFTGIVSGSYPAFILSAFKPVKVLKGSFKPGSANKNFRKLLVTFQFTLTIVLITGTIVINKQLHFLKNKDLGFNKEQVLCIKLPGKLTQKIDLIKYELQKNRQVVSLSGVSFAPTEVLSSTDVNDWEGRESENHFLIYRLSADHDFTKTMQIEMEEGRYFSRELKGDTADGCIVNKAAINAMDMKSPLGKKILGNRIIGVVKDFNFASLHSKINPLIIYFDSEEINQLLVRIKPGNISQTISSMEKAWNKMAAGFPFEYSFLDEQIDNLYRSEQRVGDVINTFSFLALFIACLGMFGLASFTAEQRTKEVGIRKVLGARISGIVFMLSKEFTKYILIANLFAWPIAYYFMDMWLQDFAYRIDIDWWLFVAAGCIAFLVALLTVSYQAIKSATANPVKALRYE
jgi:putative ABC transport system permease protein